MEIDPIIFHRRLPPIRIDTVGRSITIRSLSISLPLPPSQEEYISISLVVDDVPFFSGLILCGFGFVVSLVPDYELQLRQLPSTTTTNYNSTTTTTQQREATCTQSVLCHKPRGCRTGRGSGRCDSNCRGNGSVRRCSRPSSPVDDCRSSNATRSRP